MATLTNQTVSSPSVTDVSVTPPSNTGFVFGNNNIGAATIGTITPGRISGVESNLDSDTEVGSITVAVYRYNDDTPQITFILQAAIYDSDNNLVAETETKTIDPAISPYVKIDSSNYRGIVLVNLQFSSTVSLSAGSYKIVASQSQEGIYLGFPSELGVGVRGSNTDTFPSSDTFSSTTRQQLIWVNHPIPPSNISPSHPIKDSFGDAATLTGGNTSTSPDATLSCVGRVVGIVNTDFSGGYITEVKANINLTNSGFTGPALIYINGSLVQVSQDQDIELFGDYNQYTFVFNSQYIPPGQLAVCFYIPDNGLVAAVIGTNTVSQKQIVNKLSNEALYPNLISTSLSTEEPQISYTYNSLEKSNASPKPSIWGQITTVWEATTDTWESFVDNVQLTNV